MIMASNLLAMASDLSLVLCASVWVGVAACATDEGGKPLQVPISTPCPWARKPVDRSCDRTEAKGLGMRLDDDSRRPGPHLYVRIRQYKREKARRDNSRGMPGPGHSTTFHPGRCMSVNSPKPDMRGGRARPCSSCSSQVPFLSIARSKGHHSRATERLPNSARPALTAIGARA